MDKFFLGLGIGIIIGALLVVFDEQPQEKKYKEYPAIRLYPGVLDPFPHSFVNLMSKGV